LSHLLGKWRSHHTISRSSRGSRRLGHLGCTHRSSRSRSSGSHGSRSSSTTNTGSISFQSGNIPLILGNISYNTTNGTTLAFTGNNSGKVSIFKGLHVHIGLVGFDYHDGFAGGYGISFGFEPGDYLAFFHCGGEGWHV
jgi:hypothetical protein